MTKHDGRTRRYSLLLASATILALVVLVAIVTMSPLGSVLATSPHGPSVLMPMAVAVPQAPSATPTDPDFSILANPATLGPLDRGAWATSTVNVTLTGGFSGIVQLVAVTPEGVTATLTPSSLTGSGTSTLVVSASSAGTFSVVVNATSGGLSHSTMVKLVVEDFSLTSSSTTISFDAGSKGTVSLSVAALNGFSRSVSLTVNTSPGLTAIVSPSTIPAGAGAATVTLSSNIPGEYSLSATGTSGSLSHSLTINVHVVDFTLELSPQSIGQLNAGAHATFTISILPQDGFSDTVNLAASPSSGLDATINPTIVGSGTGTLGVSSMSAGTYLVNVTATSGTLVHWTLLRVDVVDFALSINPATVTFNSGSTATATITTTAENGFVGNIAISPTVAPGTGLAVSCPASVAMSSSSSIVPCTFSSSTQGKYSVRLTESSGSLVHWADMTVQVADFSISVSTVSLAIPAGSSATAVVMVTSLDGFAGQVDLPTPAQPESGVSVSFNPAEVMVWPDSSNSSVVTISADFTAPTGTIAFITVRGISGQLSHSITLLPVSIINAYSAPQFAFSSTSTSLTVQAGTSGTSEINVTSLNGFTGNVTVGVPGGGIFPFQPSGLTTPIARSPVFLTRGGTNSTTLTVSTQIGTPAGVYSIVVAGGTSAGGQLIGIVITLTVVSQKPLADFQITSDSTIRTIQPGIPTTVTVNLTSLYGLADTITLTVTVSPSGPAASVSPSSLSLGSGDTRSVTLTVSLPPGGVNSFIVTITASGSSQSHSLAIFFRAKPTATPNTLQWACAEGLTCSLATNSTLSRVNLQSNILSLIVTGEPGTTGYVNMTIPGALFSNIGQLNVTIDGVRLSQQMIRISSRLDSYSAYFTFDPSPQRTIQIGVPTSSPSPPPSTPGPFFQPFAGGAILQLVALVAGLAVVAVIVIVVVVLTVGRKKTPSYYPETYHQQSSRIRSHRTEGHGSAVNER